MEPPQDNAQVNEQTEPQEVVEIIENISEIVVVNNAKPLEIEHKSETIEIEQPKDTSILLHEIPATTTTTPISTTTSTTTKYEIVDEQPVPKPKCNGAVLLHEASLNHEALMEVIEEKLTKLEHNHLSSSSVLEKIDEEKEPEATEPEKQQLEPKKFNGFRKYLNLSDDSPGTSSQQPSSDDSSEKLHITAAVCNWLHSFEQPDLQSLFTIPLNADFVRKIKYCGEISNYFEHDDFDNLEKFVAEQFYQYQLVSAASSLSSLLDLSSDDDENDEQSQTRGALEEFFGCRIM